jgi:hypothetical protein
VTNKLLILNDQTQHIVDSAAFQEVARLTLNAIDAFFVIAAGTVETSFEAISQRPKIRLRVEGGLSPLIEYPESQITFDAHRYSFSLIVGTDRLSSIPDPSGEVLRPPVAILEARKDSTGEPSHTPLPSTADAGG